MFRSDAMLCPPGSSKRGRVLPSASSHFTWIRLKCKGCSRVEQPKMADARELSPPLPSSATHYGTRFCPAGGRRRDLARPLAFATWFSFPEVGFPSVCSPASPFSRRRPQFPLSQFIRAAVTKYQRWYGLSSTDVFLTVLEAGSPGSRWRQVRCPLRPFSSACR